MLRELHDESESIEWVSLLKWNLIETVATILFLLTFASKTDLSIAYDPILQERFEKSLPMSIFFAVTLFGMTIWIAKSLGNYLLLSYLLKDSIYLTADHTDLFLALVQSRKYPVFAKLILTLGALLVPKGDYISLIQRKPLIAYIVTGQFYSIAGTVVIILCVSEIIGYSCLQLRERKACLVRLEWIFIVIGEAIFLPV